MTTNKEPAFWERYLIDEPICKKVLENFESIKTEILHYKEIYPEFFVKYPKFKVVNPKTNKSERLYDQDWKVTALSKFDEDYGEISRIGKRLKQDPQEIIDTYAKEEASVTYNLVKELNLINVFVSVLSPGTIIRPHQGYCKKYMRVHMGLVCDPECKFTVGDETKAWEEGKLFAFKDGGPYYHSVLHNGTQDRSILSFDLDLDYLQPYINNY
jgi:hypothetical protein